MKNDKFYPILVSKMNQLAAVPPQTVGPFTPLYKKLTSQFKVFPFKSLLLVSFLSVIFAYLIFGHRLVKLASLLQFGF